MICFESGDILLIIFGLFIGNIIGAFISGFVRRLWRYHRDGR
jgi:uncharacterized protein YneF (UPF0154 family)